MLDGATKGDEGLVACCRRPEMRWAGPCAWIPNDPEAHGTYADLVGSDGPEAIAHMQRAAMLSPRSAERV